MGATFKNTWAGRGVCTDLRTILPLCREGNLPVLVGDVGGDPMNGVKLGGFHNSVDQCLTGKLPRYHTDGVWYTPPLEDDLK